jgi:hypothetical protein
LWIRDSLLGISENIRLPSSSIVMKILVALTDTGRQKNNIIKL